MSVTNLSQEPTDYGIGKLASDAKTPGKLMRMEYIGLGILAIARNTIIGRAFMYM